MLRGICDGEVLLDSHMNVAQESECLKHLILTSVSLRGRSFVHLLVDEEQPRFSEFIESSTTALYAADLKTSSLPLCLRVSFRGSAGIRVAADIYHVPVCGLFGSNKPYHLIAFKEDVESRPQPDAAEDSIPSELLRRRQESPPAGSMVSGSTGSTGDLQVCSELMEMTLLVDVDTELQDVEEAHLKFQRTREDQDQDLALQSNMPSLRKLLRPLDWERTSPRVVRFAERALSDPQLMPKELKHFTFEWWGQGRLSAERAELKRTPLDQKVWLHVQGIRPYKNRRTQSVSGLGSIQERAA